MKLYSTKLILIGITTRWHFCHFMVLILPSFFFKFAIKKMKVAILVYNYCSLWAAAGCMEILLRANKAQDYYNRNPRKYFEIEFVSSTKEQAVTHYNIPIQNHSTIYNQKRYDIVIVPGTDTNPLSILEENKDAITWIKNQNENEALVVSNCTGSFLLAASGILDNKTATTHWFMADLFKKRFPEIKLCTEKIIIDNKNSITSGGATSFENLMVYIIEKFLGHEIALGVSKLYLIDLNKDNQLSYSILNIQKNHGDQQILKAQDFIEQNSKNKLSLSQISEKICMSTRSFIRRFKAATGDTPFQYIQKVKVENAKRQLESGDKTFEEIAFIVGYDDANAFRKIFIRYTGITPSLYKKKYCINSRFVA